MHDAVSRIELALLHNSTCFYTYMRIGVYVTTSLREYDYEMGSSCCRSATCHVRAIAT